MVIKLLGAHVHKTAHRSCDARDVLGGGMLPQSTSAKGGSATRTHRRKVRGREEAVKWERRGRATGWKPVPLGEGRKNRSVS